MSRAIVKNGRITKITINPKLGIEVGEIPSNVGLERLFWDGKELIDLYYLTEFYVNKSTFKLSPIYQSNTVKIKMNYNDKKYLIKYNDNIRLKTKQEIIQPKLDEYKARRKNEYPTLGDQLGAILKYLKTKDDLPSELDDIIKKIDEVKEKWDK